MSNLVNSIYYFTVWTSYYSQRLSSRSTRHNNTVVLHEMTLAWTHSQKSQKSSNESQFQTRTAFLTGRRSKKARSGLKALWNSTCYFENRLRRLNLNTRRHLALRSHTLYRIATSSHRLRFNQQEISSVNSSMLSQSAWPRQSIALVSRLTLPLAPHRSSVAQDAARKCLLRVLS